MTNQCQTVFSQVRATTHSNNRRLPATREQFEPTTTYSTVHSVLELGVRADEGSGIAGPSMRRSFDFGQTGLGKQNTAGLIRARSEQLTESG